MVHVDSEVGCSMNIIINEANLWLFKAIHIPKFDDFINSHGMIDDYLQLDDVAIVTEIVQGLSLFDYCTISSGLCWMYWSNSYHNDTYIVTVTQTTKKTEKFREMRVLQYIIIIIVCGLIHTETKGVIIAGKTIKTKAIQSIFMNMSDIYVGTVHV